MANHIALQNVFGNQPQVPFQAPPGQPVSTLYIQDSRYSEANWLIVKAVPPTRPVTNALSQLGGRYILGVDGTPQRAYTFAQQDLPLLIIHFVGMNCRITSCRFDRHPMEMMDPIIYIIQGDIQTINEWVAIPSFRLPDGIQHQLEQIAFNRHQPFLQVLNDIIQHAHSLEFPAA